MPLELLSPLHRAIRQITLHLEQPMAELQIRTGEGHLLTYSTRYGPSPVGELVRIFGWKRSTLSSVLDRLEDRGLLRRSANPHDRRSLLVELTAAGHTLASRVHEPVDALEDLIRQRVSEGDLAGFRNVMGAIDAVTDVDVRAGKTNAKETP